jgi:murein DD-endopeptidase
MKRVLIVIVYFILIIWRGYGQEYHASVSMNILYLAPSTIIDGNRAIYYELHITNFARDTLELIQLDVLNRDSVLVLTLSHIDLPSRIKAIGLDENHTKTILLPGAAVVVYLEILLPLSETQQDYSHRLKLQTIRGSKRTNIVINGALMKPSIQKPLIIGAPLRAGPWVAVYEPTWQDGHRRVFYTVNGLARLPGRFAIDFIRVNNNGKYADNDENDIKNWFGYLHEVLAVSDGVVAAMEDNFDESPTIAGYKRPAIGNAKGNYISLKIGEHQYVFYEHLKTRSIRVKIGQKVKKGEILGLLGFTGQTTGPHLHLHIADENSPLGAEGIPFEFEKFILLGVYKDFRNFGRAPWTNSTGLKLIINRQRPSPNSVVKFDD